MFGICFRYLGNENDAEEALNDGFNKVFTQINKFNEGGISGLLAWMSRIIVNECLQYLRKRKKLKYINEQITKEDQLIEIPEFEIETKDYYQLIKQLGDPYRTVFNLFAIEGYNHKEISEMLNIPENTSRSHLMRARMNLKEKIKKYNTL